MATETGANRLLSYSSSGPRELWPDVSNYVLQVLSRGRRARGDGHDHDPALLMYFLDSGGGSYTEVVSSAQVRWFHTQSQFLNPDGGIPELIFWHIPSTAYTKIEKRLDKLNKSKTKDTQVKVKEQVEKSGLEKIQQALMEGEPTRSVDLPEHEKEAI
ncbi:putative inactive purple acid phosphatase 16 [Zea mays]|uniref:Putative inactive purple acid phosphatase 16 n=1 Tax=Zea mays TaxID=4577 RepID=A0A1D6I3J3_MAIZE|nr:putative inactive purple acid phosphatase 16 [Zea mays]ONM54712.1 putative inactive purple acid phosphatase 16 [Zea mays]